MMGDDLGKLRKKLATLEPNMETKFSRAKENSKNWGLNEFRFDFRNLMIFLK